MKCMLLVLRKRWSLLLIMIIRSLLSALLVYVPLMILPYIFSSINDRKRLIFYCVLFILSSVVLTPIYQVFQILLVKNTVRFSDSMIAKLYKKAMKVPYEDLMRGDVRSKIRHATDVLYYDFNYDDAITKLADILEKGFYLVFSVTICYALFNWKYIFILIAPFIIGIPLLHFYNKMYSKGIVSMIDQHGQIEREFAYYKDDIVYNYSMYPSFHIFNMFKFLHGKLKRNENDNVNYYKKSRKLLGYNTAIMSLISGVSALCSLAVIMFQVQNENIQTNEIVSCMQSFTYLYMAVFYIHKNLQELNRNMPYLDMIENILNMQEESSTGKGVQVNDLFWEFKSVCFAYENSNKEALHNINITFSNKSINALVGKNGSGKTTLVLLLAGLLKPASGEITLNGINIQEINPLIYRKIVNIVFQDSSIFPLSLHENITFSEEKLSLEKIDESIFPPHTYEADSILESNLSGGEREKVLIHRALYRKTPALILDEPNAALDVHFEEALYESLMREAKNRFVLFITHRMRSCKDCDMITVLDAGKIVGVGKHDELLESCTEYRTLWNAQVKMYDVG